MTSVESGSETHGVVLASCGGLQYLGAMAAIGNNYYPETLYCMVLVNCPMLMRALWGTAKAFLHPLTERHPIESCAPFYRSRLRLAQLASQKPRFCAVVRIACARSLTFSLRRD